MSKSFVQPGHVLTFTAPSALASGAGFLVGSMFAVAQSAAANGAQVEGVMCGVHSLTALSSDTGSVGTKMYWDDGNKRLTTSAAGNTLVGALTVAKANGETTATVRLNGTV